VGRKPVNKKRKINPEQKEEWINRLYPYFMENGFSSISMNSVASYLGKSKATVYYYFKSREEIIESIVDKKISELELFAIHLTDNSLNYKERYVKAVDYVSQVLAGISNLFLTDLHTHYPEIWNKINVFRDFAVSLLQNYYEDGISNGLFNDINPVILALSDKQFFDMLTQPDFLQKNNLSLKQAFDEYVKMRFYGIIKME
jgi:AcrR family transcriptional regulator